MPVAIIISKKPIFACFVSLDNLPLIMVLLQQQNKVHYSVARILVSA